MSQVFAEEGTCFAPGAFEPITDPIAPAAATNTKAPAYSAALGRSTRVFERPSSSLRLPNGFYDKTTQILYLLNVKFVVLSVHRYSVILFTFVSQTRCTHRLFLKLC